MRASRIELPDFTFSVNIALRISDINYGGHLGNDSVLTLIHEARLQFLKQFDFSEVDFAGVGLIIRDAAIEFKSEGFYGDVLTIHVAAADLSTSSFNLFYKMERSDSQQLVCTARTGMVCYDYTLKKVVALPAEAREKMS